MDEYDAGTVRARLAFSLHGEDEARRFEAEAERLKRQGTIERKLKLSTEDARKELDKLEKAEEEFARDAARREAAYAAMGEKTRQQKNRIFNLMRRDERAHARETEQIRKDAANAVEKLNQQMAAREAAQVRERERQLDEMRRLEIAAYAEDSKRTKRHLADMARIEEQAYRADASRTKRHHADMARVEAQAYGENARREKAAFAERERAQRDHARRSERIFGRVAQAGANVVPNLNWSTRIPVWGIVGFGVAIQAVIPPVVALAGSLEPLAGLLGAMPTLAATAGAGLLTAFLGLKGVGSALGAAWEAQASAGEDAIDTSKRQEAAAESVKNAERQLTDAIEARDDAQADANDTTREARDEMRQLRGELDDLAASEGDRVEALRQANEEVGRLRAEGASQREIAQAQRDVTHAEYELAQARERRREATDKVAKVDKHGIGVLDEVKDANERVADAEDRVTEATENVGKAKRDAARDTAELTGGAKKLDEAMRELGPAGQAFVTMVATKFFPMVKQLRSTAQEGLLPGLGDGMIEASKNAPILERAIGRIAKTMGGTALDWGKFLGSKDFGRDFEQIMGQSDELLKNGGDASIHFASGLRHVAVESEPLVGWLGRVTKQLGLNFEGWAKTNRENGKMRGWFRETVQTTKDVVGTLVDLGAGLWNIGRIGARVWGNDMRGGIRDAARDFRDWTKSVSGDRSIEQYFQRWRRRWTAVVDYIGDAIDEYKKLRKEGMSSTAALTRVLTDRFGEALVTLAERIGRLMPKVVAGFVKGFLEADGWGKLAIGTWLIAKLGGRGAFLAIGRTVGGWLGTAMAAGAMRSGIAMQIASWLKAPERTSKMTAAGNVMGRALGLGISAGIVLAIPLIGAAVAQALNEARKKIQGWIEDIPGGKALNDVTNFIGKNVAPVIPGAGGATLGEIFGANEQTRRDFEELNRQMGGKLSVATDKQSFTRAKKELADLEEDSGKRLRSIRKSMGRETEAGARAAKENFRDTAKTIERRVKDGELSTEQGMRAIKRLVKTHSEGARGAAVKEFDEMGRKVTRRLKRTKDDVGMQSRGLSIAVTGAIGGMTKFVNGTLGALGLKPISFKASKVGGDVASGADKIASGEVRASGGFAGMFAGGGLIGRWGERGRDKVHAILGRGEAVLNHYQQRAVNAALRVSGVARGGLRELFGRTRHTRHYMASGGHAGGDGASIADYYPQAFASGGYTQGAVPPQGAAIRALNEELFKRGFSVTSGYRSTSSTYHGAGHASDYGDSVNDLPSLWRVLFPRRNQFAELFGPSAFAGLFKWGKQFSDPGLQSTHEDHIHVALLSKLAGALGAGGTGAPSVPRQMLSGPDGPLKAMGQKLLDRVRKGAQGKLDQAIGDASGGHAHGQSITINADDLQSVNKVYPEHGLSDAAGHARFSPSLVERIARWAGFGHHSDEMERIAHGESDYYPGIRGDDPGGTKGWGLWQNTPGVWGESGLSYLASLGGEAQLRNPLKNAKMAKFLYDAAGGTFSPWYGTKYLASGGFAGDGASISDYFPSAGAFAAGGYTDDSAPVNIGGAVGGSGMLTGIGRRLIGLSPIESIKSRISRNESRYQSLSRRFELDDAEFITEGTETSPPTLNMAAIEDRAGDLRKLIAVRDDIYSDYQRLVFYIRRLRAVYRQMMNRLARSIERVKANLAKVGKGKDAGKRRKALQGRLGEYSGALKGAKDKFAALGVELGEAQQGRYDAHTDLMADQQELDTLLPGARADLASALDRGGSGDDDLQARADRSDEIQAAFDEYKRLANASFSVFQGPGDIGSGAQSALQAAQNPQGGMGGPGQGMDLALGPDGRLQTIGGGSSGPASQPSGAAGGGGEVHQHFYSPIPATADQLDQIGKAATAGQSLQGAVPANRSKVNV